jgi:hypothetical protein
MLTSENVTNTALALPNGLSVMRRFSVPCDPVGAEGLDGLEGESESPPQANVARAVATAAARTDARRMIFSSALRSKMSSTPQGCAQGVPAEAFARRRAGLREGKEQENRNHQRSFVTTT